MQKTNLFIAKASQISSVELLMEAPAIRLNIQGKVFDVYFKDIEKTPEHTWHKKLTNKVETIKGAWESERVGASVIFWDCEIENPEHNLFWDGATHPGDELLQRLEGIETALNTIKNK